MRAFTRIRGWYPLILLSFAIIGVVTVGYVFASSEGEHAGGGWVATDTYRMLNFLVLAGFLYFVLRKPASQFLGDRIKGIQAQLKELELKKVEAEKRLAHYNDRLSTLSREAEKIVAQYRTQGEAARARIIAEAESAAAKLEDQARRNIEQEFKKARSLLEAEVLEKAIAKAQERLSKGITEADQDRLVEEYLQKVVTR